MRPNYRKTPQLSTELTDLNFSDQNAAAAPTLVPDEEKKDPDWLWKVLISDESGRKCREKAVNSGKPPRKRGSEDFVSDHGHSRADILGRQGWSQNRAKRAALPK